MQSSDIRQEFLSFFEKRGHKIVPSSSLLPADPSVLFTTAGMQQFKPYYLGELSPFGKNAASCQKCIRTSDIEEVGDESHLTFFEMLGNFSFGGYFKKESIKWGYEFIKEMGLEIDYVTYFDPLKVEVGDWRKDVPKDLDSYDCWKNDIGLPGEKIRGEGIDNFWGPTGSEGPCGPTTEIYVKNIKGQSIEIWNIVFNEYFCDKDKKLKKLEFPGVDTGLGLERLTIMIQGVETVFETDLFQPLIKEIELLSGSSYQDNVRLFRIIADHIKASVFMASENIVPSNVERGYVLRRIIRRALHYGKSLQLPETFYVSLVKHIADEYQDVYLELKSNQGNIISIFEKERIEYSKILIKGVKDTASVVVRPNFNGDEAYRWYSTSGVPFDIIKEIALEKGVIMNETFQEDFEKGFKKHQEISRAGAVKKFGGVGENATHEQAKLHTATHLLHQALRMILGTHVQQMGSDITAQRLRFDFSQPAKMTDEEIKKVENLVNDKINENLTVTKEELPYEQAVKSGALAFFREKYPATVNVYSIGSFSKEICAGPHVDKTSELGKFIIIKEESSGAGVRRIRAILKSVSDP